MNDRPTVAGWAFNTIAELEVQLERLYSGRACRECRGSGEDHHGGPVGVFVVACPACDGSGISGGLPG